MARNEICIECHLFAGIVITSVEVFLTFFLIHSYFERFGNKNGETKVSPQNSSSSFLCQILQLVGIIVSVFGWIYWMFIVTTYWNFVSWMMLSGIIVVSPGIIWTFRMPISEARSELLKRRVKLVGWLLAVACLGLFPNVPIMPDQLYRHLYKDQVIIAPTDPGVLQLQQDFFTQIPEDVFLTMGFEQQMLAVDEFVKQEITWKTDYSQYELIGLLTTPSEVIDRMAGDCQGQSAVTASLLLSMGFNAWMVETPFHWWTHAEDPVTGRFYNLNSHGHAGTEGNVLPQPIDLVFTQPPAACYNCSYDEAHNVDPILYLAPPHRAFGVAFVGAHILVRNGVTLEASNYYQNVLVGLVIGLGMSLYAAYYRSDCNLIRFVKRSIVACLIGVTMETFGTCFWGSFYYNIGFIHLVGINMFAFNYLSSDSFNTFL